MRSRKKVEGGVMEGQRKRIERVLFCLFRGEGCGGLSGGVTVRHP